MLPRRTLLTLPLLATRPAHAQTCPRQLIAELPLRLVENYPIITATIAGQPASFILDTGAQGMLITPEAAQALQLPLRGLTRIFGTGGSEPARLVLVPALRLGGAPMPDQRAPVSPLPVQLTTDPPLAGLLGASLLSHFDLELDVPRLRVTLWAPSDCTPPFPGETIPLEISREGEAFMPIRLNNEPLLALLDTGSRATLLTQTTARRLGLGSTISANTARGVDGQRMPLEHVQARLAIGTRRPETTPVSIADLQLPRGDLLLGLDVLSRHRLFLAYARNEITFAP